MTWQDIAQRLALEGKETTAEVGATSEDFQVPTIAPTTVAFVIGLLNCVSIERQGGTAPNQGSGGLVRPGKGHGIRIRKGKSELSTARLPERGPIEGGLRLSDAMDSGAVEDRRREDGVRLSTTSKSERILSVESGNAGQDN
nr:NADH-ubiquinone oxidoreductase chain 2 [Ipomoea batatas]